MDLKKKQARKVEMAEMVMFGSKETSITKIKFVYSYHIRMFVNFVANYTNISKNVIINSK